MLPVLHIILGITKKLWENIVVDLQCSESDSYLEKLMISEARDNLAWYIAKIKSEKAMTDETYNLCEAQWAEMNKLFNAMKWHQPPATAQELLNLQHSYKEAMQWKAESNSIWKAFNLAEIDL